MIVWSTTASSSDGITRMTQGWSGGRAAPHRPRHARVSGFVLLVRAGICLTLFAGLALAVGLAGSGGPAGVGVARAAEPRQSTESPAVIAEQDVQRNAAAPATGVEHSVAAADPSTSDSPDLGLAPISDRFPASGLASDGIPITALTAYQAAAVREAELTPDCGLPWPLLAGIGRVESDHGRFAGAVLHSDGLSSPRVIGIPLNGHGTALIRDTDNGALDGDTVYDRAVGPMQFIPSTWAGWGVDANHDGVKDPFNIFDAAAAAADYLCAAGRDLTTTHGQVQAILSYNYSWDYVHLVMSLEKVYASGAVGVTVPVLPTTPDKHGRPAHTPSLPPVDPGQPIGVGSGGDKPHPKPTPTTPHPTPSGSATSTAPAGAGSSTSSGSSSSSGPGSSTSAPAPTDPTCPTDSPSASSSDSPSPTPSDCPSPPDSESSAADASGSSSEQSPQLSSAQPTATDPASSGA
jgi:membrane-bound lytic murein transglycosylase B